MGAIASGGVQVLNPEILRTFGVTNRALERVIAEERRELERREWSYRGGRPALDLRGNTVILVDDGLATGSSMRTAVTAVRRLQPARVVVAVPVAPPSVFRDFQGFADEVACAAYAAFRSLDLERSRIVRLLFAIRTLPSRFRRREAPPDTPSTSFLDAALAVGWRVLEEVPGREIVVGAVTQPWAPVVRFRGLSGPEFVEFAEPGFTKIAWGITATPEGPVVTRLATETRVAATDPVSRKRFRRYWRVVSPGIRLIRRISLRMVQRELEASRRAA